MGRHFSGKFVREKASTWGSAASMGQAWGFSRVEILTPSQYLEGGPCRVTLSCGRENRRE